MLNIEKWPYFSVLKSCLLSWYVLKDLVLWNWLVSTRLKVVLKLFILSSSRHSFTKSMFWGVISLLVLELLIYLFLLKLEHCLVRPLWFWWLSLAMFLFSGIQCLGIVPIPGIHRLNESYIESNILFLIGVEK